MSACTLPPAGWFCTRDKGHPGPCAAWPASTPRLHVAAQALCTPIRLHSVPPTTRPCHLCKADAADMLAALDAMPAEVTP